MKSVASKVFTSVFTVLCGWTAFAEWSWSGKSGDSYFSGSGRIRVGQFMPGVLLLVR